MSRDKQPANINSTMPAGLWEAHLCHQGRMDRKVPPKFLRQGLALRLNMAESRRTGLPSEQGR
jgi:hypothetical protein